MNDVVRAQNRVKEDLYALLGWEMLEPHCSDQLIMRTLGLSQDMNYASKILSGPTRRKGDFNQLTGIGSFKELFQ